MKNKKPKDMPPKEKKGMSHVPEKKIKDYADKKKKK